MNFMTLTDREKLIQLITSLNAVYAFRTTEINENKYDVRQAIRTTAFEFLPSLSEQDYKKLLNDLRENELNLQTTLEFLANNTHALD